MTAVLFLSCLLFWLRTGFSEAEVIFLKTLLLEAVLDPIKTLMGEVEAAGYANMTRLSMIPINFAAQEAKVEAVFLAWNTFAAIGVYAGRPSWYGLLGYRCTKRSTQCIPSPFGATC